MTLFGLSGKFLIRNKPAKQQFDAQLNNTHGLWNYCAPKIAIGMKQVVNLFPIIENWERSHQPALQLN